MATGNYYQPTFFKISSFVFNKKEIQTGLEQLFIISGWTYAFKLLFAVAPAQLQPLYSYLNICAFFLEPSKPHDAQGSKDTFV